MTKRLMILTACCFLWFPTPVFAGCKEKLQNVPESMVYPQTWDDFYKSYQVYGDCGATGWMAEAFSDAVARLFAKDWKNFSRFVVLSNENKVFLGFTLHHIDATADPDDLKAALKNVTVDCPRKAKGLCEEIKKELTLALKDAEL